MNTTIPCEAGDILKLQVVSNGSSLSLVGNGAYNYWSGYKISNGMATSPEGRIVSMRAEAPTSALSGTGDVVASWGAVDQDTHDAFNPTTGEYVVPVSGTYVVNASFDVSGTMNSAGNMITYLQKNGSAVAGFTLASVTGTTSSVTILNTTVECVAGDILRILISANVDSGLSFGNGGVFNYLSIYKLSGPATIAANEIISVIADNPTSSITNAMTDITGWTTEEDSHDTCPLCSHPVSRKADANAG